MQINLLDWYRKNSRQLPWREDPDPYKIWISEIILQQTRVAQGIDYYFHFLEKFPNVSALANSLSEDVNAVWQGLGYYRRAMLLHQGAKFVMKNYGGILPQSYDELKKIPGIGSYTAAAIASIAFSQPVIALDGNLKRIAARVGCIKYVITSSDFEKQAIVELSRFFPNDRPGDGNQALMDLSALICTPQNPSCHICPLNTICCAFLSSTQNKYPVKPIKKPKKDRYFWYLIHFKETTAAFYKRPANDIWAGLWDFPLIETSTANESDFISAVKNNYPDISFEIAKMIPLVKPHVLSHQRIFTTLVFVANRTLNIPNISYFELENPPPSSILVKKIKTKILKNIKLQT